VGRGTPVSLDAVAQTHHLSQSAFDRLKAEYDDLTTRGRIEIARKIETARELGDLSENGDYHAAKEEQGHMEGRIAHLAAMIDNAEIVETPAGAETVHPGSIVSIVYEDDDAPERYLVGSIEERHDDLEVVSLTSPLGAALLGAGVGDEVTYETPTGAKLTVTVVEIEN
jgi:transcription elongation factor GreA